MPTPRMTVDEIVDTLKHSSLSTVLVEGEDDAYIFRELERELGIGKADVLWCGGRLALLRVFERRAEFASLRTAFIADRDMWLFSAVPAQYGGVIFTEGYSIENDLLGGFDFLRLLEESERQEFRQLIELVIPWFAFEVSEFLAGRAAHVDVHINQLVPAGAVAVDAQWLALRGFAQADQGVVDDLRQNYVMKLRGHLLVGMLLRFLSSGARRARYNTFSLLEIPIKLGLAHPKWQRIIEEVKTALGIVDTSGLFGGIAP